MDKITKNKISCFKNIINKEFNKNEIMNITLELLELFELSKDNYDVFNLLDNIISYGHYLIDKNIINYETYINFYGKYEKYSPIYLKED